MTSFRAVGESLKAPLVSFFVDERAMLLVLAGEQADSEIAELIPLDAPTVSCTASRDLAF